MGGKFTQIGMGGRLLNLELHEGCWILFWGGGGLNLKLHEGCWILFALELLENWNFIHEMEPALSVVTHTSTPTPLPTMHHGRWVGACVQDL